MINNKFVAWASIIVITAISLVAFLFIFQSEIIASYKKMKIVHVADYKVPDSVNNENVVKVCQRSGICIYELYLPTNKKINWNSIEKLEVWLDGKLLLDDYFYLSRRKERDFLVLKFATVTREKEPIEYRLRGKILKVNITR